MNGWEELSQPRVMSLETSKLNSSREKQQEVSCIPQSNAFYST